MMGRARSRWLASPVSPVRMRIVFVRSETKIFPSPIWPVWAVRMIVSITVCRLSSATATSILTLGTNSTLYSVPRYISVCPFCRPNPRTSVIVMPRMPWALREFFTSSSLKMPNDRFDFLHGTNSDGRGKASPRTVTSRGEAGKVAASILADSGASWLRLSSPIGSHENVAFFAVLSQVEPLQLVVRWTRAGPSWHPAV